MQVTRLDTSKLLSANCSDDRVRHKPFQYGPCVGPKPTFPGSSAAERLPVKEDVGGSNPSLGAETVDAVAMILLPLGAASGAGWVHPGLLSCKPDPKLPERPGDGIPPGGSGQPVPTIGCFAPLLCLRV